MDYRTLSEILALAEKLKCYTRHSWTSGGRQESVAEHTYRLCVFAWLVKEEFPQYDMDRVIRLCLFHDLGEAVTGDVPCFWKDEKDERREEEALEKIADMLPHPYNEELQEIFREIHKKQTPESRLACALDKLEAVIQHNEASIDTWLPLEYQLQLTHGQEQCRDIPYMKELRDAISRDVRDKIQREGSRQDSVEAGYTASSDRRKLNFKRVVELMRQSYWAKDRSEEMIRKGMEQSKAYGLYDPDGYMAGYARVITDEVSMFYLCDVIIDEKLRRQGLGSILMDKIIEEEGHLRGILRTRDAVRFYENYGYKVVGGEDKTLMIREAR